MNMFNAKYAPFWYHPDHLGSSSYITNLDGEINQHLEYLPFGETLIKEHLNSYNSSFKFNAKEFDAETGNYYYGARYYDPKWSVWLSVDPLAEEFPEWSPYSYTLNNPIRFIDPDGRAPIDPVKITTYVAKKVAQFKMNTSGAQRNLKGALNNRVEAEITGRERSNAQILNTGISVDATRDAATISQSLNTISNEAGSIAKDVTRDVANTMEVVGDCMVVCAPATGPLAPAVAGTGATISTGGTILNVGLDAMEGDSESAGKRILIEVTTGGLSTLAKNAPGVDEATSRIINSIITINENVVIPAIEHKIKEKKTENNQ